MAHNQTATQVIFPTNKQKRFAYDISNLLGYPLPKNTLGEYAKFLADSIIVYHNTPTLDVMPTRFDNTLAASIKASGELLEIPLENYIIISMNESYTC